MDAQTGSLGKDEVELLSFSQSLDSCGHIPGHARARKRHERCIHVFASMLCFLVKYSVSARTKEHSNTQSARPTDET